ncbi:MAG: CAP domain-containing protein [Nanoarchaeota archaeon]
MIDINIDNINKKRFLMFLFIIGLILVQINFINAAEKGGIPADDAKNLEKVNAELRTGNFANLIATIEKTDITHSSILFGSLDNSRLIEAWNKLEIKKANGEVDSEKTNNYRQMLLGGRGDSKALDSFIGNLIKSNNKIKEFEFKGSENAKGAGSIVVDGNFIILKDSSGNVHKIPLKDLKGFKKISFSEMSSGGVGYAVHYTFEKGSESGIILSSGYLKGDDKFGYDVMDIAGKEIKSTGHVSFGESPQGAIYFRGVPKEVSGEKFSKGDYIFSKPGRAGDISFQDELGMLEFSERDILNNQGLRVGYQSETGARGIKKLDGNGDKMPDKIIDIVHQNGVGIKYGNRIIGENSNKKIEITDRGEDIDVVSSLGIINTQITNNNGKVFSKGSEQREVNSGKGEPLKIVNGVIRGTFVYRQDSGAGSGSGRFNPGAPGAGSIQNNLQFVSQELGGGQNPINPVNPIENTPDYQTFSSVNSARGRGLQWDAEMSRKAQEYSQLMSTRLGLVHSNMNYAENIAMFTSYQQLSPQQIGKRFGSMWINSPGHRSNIMNRGNSRTGVGVYVRNNGGMYTYYATQIFAR